MLRVLKVVRLFFLLLLGELGLLEYFWGVAASLGGGRSEH